MKLSKRDIEHEKFQDRLACSARFHDLVYLNPSDGIKRAPWLTLSQWDAEPYFCRWDRIAEHPDMLINRILKKKNRLKFKKVKSYTIDF
jgi:hypothetical protein